MQTMYWICISFSKISMETFNGSLLKLNNYGRGSYRYQMIFTFGEEFGWLRFRSGSVWPSVLGHAAFNAQACFGVLLLSPANSLVRAPIVVVGLVPMMAFVIWLAATGRLKVDV